MSKMTHAMNEIKVSKRKYNQMNKNSTRVINNQKRKDKNFISYNWPSNKPVTKSGISNLFIKIEQLASKESNGSYLSTINNKSHYDNGNKNKKNIFDKLSPKERRREEEEDELKAFGKFVLCKKENNRTNGSGNNIVNTTNLHLKLNTLI